MRKSITYILAIIFITGVFSRSVKADSSWELYFYFNTESGRVSAYEDESVLDNIKVKDGEEVSAEIMTDDFYDVSKIEVKLDEKLIDTQSSRADREGYEGQFCLYEKFIASGEQGSVHTVNIRWYATSKRDDEESREYTFKYTIEGIVQPEETEAVTELQSEVSTMQAEEQKSGSDTSKKVAPIIPIAVAGGVGASFALVKFASRKKVK